MSSEESVALVMVEGRSWAMHEPRLRAVCEYLAGRTLTMEVEARKASGPETHGSVSVVDLKGPIMPGPSFLSLLFGGGGGLPDFMAQMRGAVGDPDTNAVVVNIDSPGGLVDLVPEAATELRAMRDGGGKPIVAVANTLAASAAYWLASQAHEVVVTPSGEVGSVGVYQVHRDLSAAYAQEGVKHTIIHAGARKIEGNPYGPLDEDAAAHHQQAVNDYYEMFVSDVAQGRGVDRPGLADGLAFGGGRTYLAKRAVNAGLADRVATLGETVRRLNSGRAKVRQIENARAVLEDAPVAYDKQQRLRLLDALTSR